MRVLRTARPSTPVTVLASCDPVLREAALADLLCDVPGLVVVRHSLGPRRDDGLRRTVLDASGVVEDVRVELEHSCLGCALREDALPAVLAAATSGRWSRVVLALPVTAEPVPAVQALGVGEVAGRPVRRSVHVDGVAVVVRGPGLGADLFGDDLWVERGQGSDEVDARSVGETVARALEEADVVLLAGPTPPSAATALRHLAGARVDVLPLHEAPSADVVRPRRPSGRARSGDLVDIEHPGVTDRDGVWTVLLDSPLPLHPQRLRTHAEALGGGRLRTRGAFWVPSRPGTACAFDGGGGQVSIGTIGPWRGRRQGTRLLVTGCGEGGAEKVRQAFADALATPEEVARGDWAAADDDGLSSWLGSAQAGADVGRGET